MIFKPTPLADAYIVEPQPFQDERGWFVRTYCKKEFQNIGFDREWLQLNHSYNLEKGTLRGLHFQKPPFAQAKLIRVILGSILDVAVDLRINSSTYGQHFKHVLSGDNKKQLYIPIGFAHGFLCLEDNTIINYKCSDYYQAESESSILWNDIDLKIDWGIKNPILAEKDQIAENLITFENPF